MSDTETWIRKNFGIYEPGSSSTQQFNFGK